MYRIVIATLLLIALPTACATVDSYTPTTEEARQCHQECRRIYQSCMGDWTFRSVERHNRCTNQFNGCNIECEETYGTGVIH